jgi:hypothetical protein
MRRFLVAVALVAPWTAACQVITEQLPNRPSPINAVGAIPIINIPVPVPTPVPTPVAVVPTPRSPNANPTPRPDPEPEPEPEPEPDGGQNTNPVARVACNVYFVECDGQVVPGTGGAREARVGCRVHLDATTKDSNNEHTYRTAPHWSFSNPGMIDVANRNSWNPTFTGKGRHSQTVYAEADGARCNAFTVEVY